MEVKQGQLFVCFIVLMVAMALAGKSGQKEGSTGGDGMSDMGKRSTDEMGKDTDRGMDKGKGKDMDKEMAKGVNGRYYAVVGDTEVSVYQKGVCQNSIRKVLEPCETSQNAQVRDSHSMTDRSMRDDSMGNSSMGEHSMGDRSDNAKSMSDKSMSDKSMSDKSMSDKSMSDKSMNNKCTYGKPITFEVWQIKSVMADGSATQCCSGTAFSNLNTTLQEMKSAYIPNSKSANDENGINSTMIQVSSQLTDCGVTVTRTLYIAHDNGTVDNEGETFDIKEGQVKSSITITGKPCGNCPTDCPKNVTIQVRLQASGTISQTGNKVAVGGTRLVFPTKVTCDGTPITMDPPPSPKSESGEISFDVVLPGNFDECTYDPLTEASSEPDENEDALDASNEDDDTNGATYRQLGVPLILAALLSALYTV